MSEVRFYHLTGRSAETVLPVMLARCLERGWRAVVRGGARERLDVLDRLLWTYDQSSFLPHGRVGAAPGTPADHPVWLTDGDELPNAPHTLFLLDGAVARDDELAALDMVALLFDGHDEAAVEAARADWRRVRASGLKAVYWAEGAGGGWEKRAESG